VLEHLKTHGMITPLEALNKYGSLRLGAIIHTLRHEDGYDIKTTLAKGDSKYAIYSLTDNKCNDDDQDWLRGRKFTGEKPHEMKFEQIADNVYREKRTSMEQAADAEDPNKMQGVKDRLWDKGFKYIGKGPKATQDKSDAEDPHYKPLSREEQEKIIKREADLIAEDGWIKYMTGGDHE